MTCKVVAEISANHLGSFNRACNIVDAAKAAGAHAVKLQTWATGTMVLDPTLVVGGGPWAGQHMADIYDTGLLPWKTQAEVFRYAKAIGIECFASVFDLEALQYLELLDCPRYKIASFELVDLPLIRAVAATGKPIILSTGMAYKEEITDAVETARRAGAKDITLLKCTSAYPTPPDQANLATMASMARLWDVKAGLSDHTQGIGVAVAAAALGASMIEKHVTMARADGGPDATFSIEPRELARLVEEVARAEHCMGSAAAYGPTHDEKPHVALRRSLHFATDLAAGTTIGRAHVCTARPANGLPPRLLGSVVGAKTTADVHRGDPVSYRVIERQMRVAVPT